MNKSRLVCPAANAVSITRHAISVDVTTSLNCAAQRCYQNIMLLMETQSVDATAASLPQTQKFLPHASSFSLHSLNDQALVIHLLKEIAQGPAASEIRKMLGRHQVSCDYDQAWIRRQYAPHLYPPEHAPHGWHQDGALGFDFLASKDIEQEASPLLPTVTCWIALTRCGVDAPGLEFVTETIDELLVPNELSHKSILNRYSSGSLWQPQMQAGDAVIFKGGTLHRTHVVEQMRANRTSVELRFVATHKIPTRLIGDCFIALPDE
ncbi:phytanoyl-CoA dioxygenase family protein [Paraglaciecola arctica]|uniref:phytanoyl-CoA dioxygenase family protein n=1 Tax=Paraglaciecola arctica TaxID=1128911 RepID=UPI001C079DC5|nr:phytanoyl-CoA dioxygenase family protein [Paraglaciecola arctica]MBU3005755.1 phytanoyl-CoA dioxygenase family protein [Paraglaciecola arctica]